METASQPLVSIVTPVYNEAEYLAECVESVLAQTYTNWEYTIVDNCSTDGSGEIARRYAAKDARIRVHHNQKFLKAIENHNSALRQVSPKAKYCKVVLGDDWIFPECLEKMVAVGERYPSAGVIGAYSLEGNDVNCVGLSYAEHLVTGREICRRHFLEKLYVFGTATSLLYRADLVRAGDPLFNEANIHADTEACFALLAGSDFGFVHQVLTFTRVRPRSLSSVSSDVQSDLPAMLHLLTHYGPNCLTSEELEACLARHLSDYYRYLGKSLLLRRDANFWSYHKKGLANAGLTLDKVRVITGALRAIGGVALDPRNVLNQARKWADRWTHSDTLRGDRTRPVVDIKQIE